MNKSKYKKKSVWINPKNNKEYHGEYTWVEVDGRRERVFNLSPIGKASVISFESFQAAKKLGWVKKQ